MMQAARFPPRIQRGSYWDLVTAPSFTDRNVPIVLGVTQQKARIIARSSTTLIQYYDIVRRHLMDAAHMFRGVRRPMKVGDDMRADASTVAYVWRPTHDVRWVDGHSGGTMPQTNTPPSGLVFVVLARPYSALDEYGVSGELLGWDWVDGNEDTLTPIDEDERYDQRIW